MPLCGVMGYLTGNHNQMGYEMDHKTMDIRYKTTDYPVQWGGAVPLSPTTFYARAMHCPKAGNTLWVLYGPGPSKAECRFAIDMEPALPARLSAVWGHHDGLLFVLASGEMAADAHHHITAWRPRAFPASSSFLYWRTWQ